MIIDILYPDILRGDLIPMEMSDLVRDRILKIWFPLYISDIHSFCIACGEIISDGDGMCESCDARNDRHVEGEQEWQ